MAQYPDLPEVNEFLGLKSRVMSVLEAGENPSPEELHRLRSLEALLRRAGINPEELFHQRTYRTSGEAPTDLEGIPENILRPISRDIVFNRVTEIGGEGYASYIEAIEQGHSGLARVTEIATIIAACGRRITEVGGRCSVCSKYECPEHVFFCQADGCHISLCFRHVHFFSVDGESIPLCKKHFRRAVRGRNIWDEEDHRREGR